MEVIYKYPFISASAFSASLFTLVYMYKHHKNKSLKHKKKIDITPILIISILIGVVLYYYMSQYDSKCSNSSIIHVFSEKNAHISNNESKFDLIKKLNELRQNNAIERIGNIPEISDVLFDISIT